MDGALQVLRSAAVARSSKTVERARRIRRMAWLSDPQRGDEACGPRGNVRMRAMQIPSRCRNGKCARCGDGEAQSERQRGADEGRGEEEVDGRVRHVPRGARGTR